MFNTYSAKIGDRIFYTRDGIITGMTIWCVYPAGSCGRANSAGPVIAAHTRPGGFGIVFDTHSTDYQFITN